MARKLRILVAGNADKAGVRAAARELVRLIGLHRSLSCAGVDLARNKDFSRARAGMILALGGDGTVLNICRRMGGRQRPVLGIRFGHKGFLAEVLPEEMAGAVERLARGAYTISERMRIEARVLGGRRRGRKLVALNEVAVHAGPMARRIDVNVRVDGESVLAYDGDGIVAATPTGSTAYSLAAGGPIVAQEMEAVVIAPVSPHTLTARPLVVGPQSKVEIHVHCRERRATVIADGQDACNLVSGDSVLVNRHPRPFLLVDLGTRGRYQPVRDNLGRIPGSKH